MRVAQIFFPLKIESTASRTLFLYVFLWKQLNFISEREKRSWWRQSGKIGRYFVQRMLGGSSHGDHPTESVSGQMETCYLLFCVCSSFWKKQTKPKTWVTEGSCLKLENYDWLPGYLKWVCSSVFATCQMRLQRRLAFVIIDLSSKSWKKVSGILHLKRQCVSQTFSLY